jgi:hypothetical protein
MYSFKLEFSVRIHCRGNGSVFVVPAMMAALQQLSVPIARAKCFFYQLDSQYECDHCNEIKDSRWVLLETCYLDAIILRRALGTIEKYERSCIAVYSSTWYM